MGQGKPFTHLEILWCRQLVLHVSVTRSLWNFPFRKWDVILQLAWQYARRKRSDIQVSKNWNRHFKENFLRALTIYPIVTFTDALLFHVQSLADLEWKIFSREWFWRIHWCNFYLLWCAECLSKWRFGRWVGYFEIEMLSKNNLCILVWSLAPTYPRPSKIGDSCIGDSKKNTERDTKRDFLMIK